MKKLTFIALATLLLAACNKESIRGSGATITENRTVAPFTGVRLEGSGKAVIIQSPTASVDVTGYQNLVSIYETNVVNNILVLKFRNDYHNIRNNNVWVRVNAPMLNFASINGSGEVTISNFTGNSIETEINGSGSIFISSSQYQLARYRINGSGTINSWGLIVADANATISGAGRIDLHCSDKLDATISGSGEINYWGNPAQVSTNISGSGKVVHKS